MVISVSGSPENLPEPQMPYLPCVCQINEKLERYYIPTGGHISKSKMLSFRLDEPLLRKVNMLRVSRHRTRGEIIREALELYFRSYNPMSGQTIHYPDND